MREGVESWRVVGEVVRGEGYRCMTQEAVEQSSISVRKLNSEEENDEAAAAGLEEEKEEEEEEEEEGTRNGMGWTSGVKYMR